MQMGIYKARSLIQKQHASLYCFPNPTNGSATLSFESNFQGKGHFSICDTQGNVLASDALEVKEGINTVILLESQVAALPSGVYHLFLQTEEGRKTGKLVKL